MCVRGEAAGGPPLLPSSDWQAALLWWELFACESSTMPTRNGSVEPVGIEQVPSAPVWSFKRRRCPLGLGFPGAPSVVPYSVISLRLFSAPNSSLNDVPHVSSRSPAFPFCLYFFCPIWDTHNNKSPSLFFSVRLASFLFLNYYFGEELWGCFKNRYLLTAFSRPGGLFVSSVFKGGPIGCLWVTSAALSWFEAKPEKRLPYVCQLTYFGTYFIYLGAFINSLIYI